MTRYTVIWSNDALNQLAQMWMAAPHGSALNAAANAIDAELGDDPQTKGSALSEGLRFLEMPPLYILFSVAEQDRVVRVVLVRASASKVPGKDGNGQLTN